MTSEQSANGSGSRPPREHYLVPTDGTALEETATTTPRATLLPMDVAEANRAAGALLERAPGAAQGDTQRLDARRAQLVGVVQDLIPGGGLWQLMARLPGDEESGTLDWTLTVLGEEALYRVVLVETQVGHRELRVKVLRIPFDLITIVSVTDSRSYDHGAHRLGRLWRFTIGRSVWDFDEDRILGAALDSDDRFTHELARRAGWPVNRDLVES